LLYLSTAPVTYGTRLFSSSFRPNEIVIYESFKFEGKLRGRKRYKGRIIYNIRYRDARDREEGERSAPYRYTGELEHTATAPESMEQCTLRKKNPKYTVYRRVEPYMERKAETSYRQCFSSDPH
jgi:hypothetical protein